MPEKKSKMVCPECGVEMNHHAEKLAEPVNAEEARRADPVLGGIIEEVHTCPDCGHSASRRQGLTA